MDRANSIFHRIVARKLPRSPQTPEVGESVIGKTFSLDLFKKYLSDLGYSFKVYVDKEDKIYAFERTAPREENVNGDVW